MLKKKNMSGAVMAAISMLLVACSPSDEEQAAQPPAQQQQQPQQQAASQAPLITLPNFVNLVKEQGQTVVNISAVRTATGPGGLPPLRQGDPLYEFFRRFGMAPDMGEAPAGSLGSGFIISQDGYILTNAHVIADTNQVTVKLTNKREYQAKVIGMDPYTDVALLKINASGLPTVKIGNPAAVDPGQWVAAIGAPFGFDSSVTVGVVSAKGRLLPSGSYVPFIQTDVAVNPGNSGGPLFNTAGEVIGINSQIYSQTGGYMGISFAIPIDIAIGISDQLRESGKVTRGRIGVQVQEMTVELASSFGLKEPRGALVAAIERGGPADQAGIRPGDVVLSINGQAVETSADLARLVGGTRPGTTIDVEIWRNGSSQTVKVPVAELSS